MRLFSLATALMLCTSLPAVAGDDAVADEQYRIAREDSRELEIVYCYQLYALLKDSPEVGRHFESRYARLREKYAKVASHRDAPLERQAIERQQREAIVGKGLSLAETSLIHRGCWRLADE
jgi:hypothetical protein